MTLDLNILGLLGKIDCGNDDDDDDDEKLHACGKKDVNQWMIS